MQSFLGRRLAGLSAAALFVAVGCSHPNDEGSADEAIRGGEEATGSPYGYSVLLYNARGLCSGTLIAPNLVLTARHCVADSSDETCTTARFADPSVKTMLVVTGSSPMADDFKIRTVKTITVPAEPKMCGHDIALLTLESNVPESEARPATPFLGALTKSAERKMPLAMMGYGENGSDRSTAATRRIRKDVKIACIVGAPGECQADADMSKGEIKASGGACPGDSGGGVFLQSTLDQSSPVVLGVMVRARIPSCSLTILTRTDTFADLLIESARDAAEAGGYDVPAWARKAPVGHDETPAEPDAHPAPSDPTAPPSTPGSPTPSTPTDPATGSAPNDSSEGPGTWAVPGASDSPGAPPGSPSTSGSPDANSDTSPSGSPGGEGAPRGSGKNGAGTGSTGGGAEGAGGGGSGGTGDGESGSSTPSKSAKPAAAKSDKSSGGCSMTPTGGAPGGGSAWVLALGAMARLVRRGARSRRDRA